MRKVFVVAIVLFLLLVAGCGTTEPTVNSETFIVVDRQTGIVYHPDLEPKPEVVGSTITFVQDGKAYILCGNWILEGELNGN